MEKRTINWISFAKSNKYRLVLATIVKKPIHIKNQKWWRMEKTKDNLDLMKVSNPLPQSLSQWLRRYPASLHVFTLCWNMARLTVCSFPLWSPRSSLKISLLLLDPGLLESLSLDSSFFSLVPFGSSVKITHSINFMWTIGLQNRTTLSVIETASTCLLVEHL